MTTTVKKIPALKDERWPVTGICFGLIAITFAVFGQTLRHGFINVDDEDYVYDNPVVSRGLTVRGLEWAFSGAHAANWHPLTWLSHMLDCQLYGINPAGHHLTNIVLHCMTTITLFLVLRAMTGTLWRSAFVAAVFAIHPLRVESVAWISERKDVLSGFFFLLTIGAYARFARRPKSVGRYAAVVCLFVLALMSKPMVVTLPLILLLLDYWPLRRTEHLSQLIREKVPLLVLAAASCVVTIWAQHEGIQTAGYFSLGHRLGNAMTACLVYLGQMAWPAGLVAFYPFRELGTPIWDLALAGIGLAIVSILVWTGRRSQPWLIIGWLWYLIMLLPVLGIIQVGSQAHADRYTYLPQIGIYVAVVWMVAEWHLNRFIMNTVMLGLIVALMLCAWKQTAYWRNSETLWSHALRHTEENALAHCNLGIALLQRGDTDGAISQYKDALQIRPDDVTARFGFANALLKEGKINDAINQLFEALKVAPNYAEVHNTLGSALLKIGKVDEAVGQFQSALKIKPDYAQADYNLANILLQKGNIGAAIGHYQHALQVDPNYAAAQVNLGDALLQEGRMDEAISHYESALRIDPKLAAAEVNLGSILLRRGQVDEAIIHFQNALRIRPNFAEAHENLGQALEQKGNMADAIHQFQSALQSEPNDPETGNNLAWLLATSPDAALRDGSKALQLAQKANQITGGKNPFVLRTLAAAFAETGQFEEARRNAQTAIDLAKQAGQQQLTEQLDNELKLYAAGRSLP